MELQAVSRMYGWQGRTLSQDRAFAHEKINGVKLTELAGEAGLIVGVALRGIHRGEIRGAVR